MIKAAVSQVFNFDTGSSIVKGSIQADLMFQQIYANKPKVHFKATRAFSNFKMSDFEQCFVRIYDRKVIEAHK